MSGVALQSSWLAAAHYQDPASVLELEFCDGAVYAYLDVPRKIFVELIQAESPGRYFNAQIRKRFVSAQRRAAASGVPAQGGGNVDHQCIGVAGEC